MSRVQLRFRGRLLAAVLAAAPAAAAAQSISINDVTVPFETNGGAGLATFTVTITGLQSGRQASVFYSTTGGTATGGSSCGPGIDYATVNSLAVTFTSAQPTQSINITVCGDALDENDETFLVNLFNPSGATIADAQGQATLIDDDPAPSLRVNDVTVTEGNAGAVTNASVSVVLSAPSGKNVTVTVGTANRTATGGACGTAGVDYANTSVPITFPAAGTNVTGQPTQTVTIPVCGDAIREGNEQFEARLSNENNATVQRRVALVTITDNEPLPTISIADAPLVGEPAVSFETVRAVFTVTLTGPATQSPVTVNFATAGGTASAGTTCAQIRFGTLRPGDFISQSGTLTFPAGGPATQQILVPICNDLDRGEAQEQFTVTLTNPVNAQAGDMTAVGTIR